MKHRGKDREGGGRKSLKCVATDVRRWTCRWFRFLTSAAMARSGFITLLSVDCLNLPAQSAPMPQRFPNTSLQMPQVPQTFGYKTEKAFGTLLFATPVAIRTAPGETNRLFVVEQGGKIFAITNLAAPNKTLFLDLSKQVRVGGDEGFFAL